MAARETETVLKQANPNPVAIMGSDGTNLYLAGVNSGGAIAVQPQGSQGSLTSRSSSIAAGNTSQQLCAANTSRKYLYVQNPSTLTGQGIAGAESLFIRFGATAATVNTGTSIELVSGASFTMENNFVSTEAVQVISTTINHKFVAFEG